MQGRCESEAATASYYYEGAAWRYCKPAEEGTGKAAGGAAAHGRLLSNARHDRTGGRAARDAAASAALERRESGAAGAAAAVARRARRPVGRAWSLPSRSEQGVLCGVVMYL